MSQNDSMGSAQDEFWQNKQDCWHSAFLWNLWNRFLSVCLKEPSLPVIAPYNRLLQMAHMVLYAYNTYQSPMLTFRLLRSLLTLLTRTCNAYQSRRALLAWTLPLYPKLPGCSRFHSLPWIPFSLKPASLPPALMGSHGNLDSLNAFGYSLPTSWRDGHMAVSYL